ncbi:hypothetical protein FRC18_011893 [Serendipita sp. 400]|nr:hypothetical protein FRC18_011893 [Serendipita sp. 400]
MEPGPRPIPDYPAEDETYKGLACTFPTTIRVLDAGFPPLKDQNLSSPPLRIGGSVLPVDEGDVLEVEERFTDNYWLVSVNGKTGYVLMRDFMEMSIGKKVVAIWDRRPVPTEELSFGSGDVINVLRRHNNWWYWGQVSNRVGLFPLTYIEPIPKGSEDGTEKENSLGRARALWDYEATEVRDLSLKKGNIIDILSKFHDNWWLGVFEERVGIFPSSYVTTNLVPRVSRPPPFHPYYVRALYDLDGSAEVELNLIKGDVISIDEMYADMWWIGRGPDGRTGWLPENYIQPVLDRRDYED